MKWQKGVVIRGEDLGTFSAMPSGPLEIRVPALVAWLALILKRPSFSGQAESGHRHHDELYVCEG